MPYPRKLLNDYETVAVDLHPHWWYFAQPVAALVGSIILGVLARIYTDGTGTPRAALVYLVIALIVASMALGRRSVPQVDDDELRDHV